MLCNLFACFFLSLFLLFLLVRGRSDCLNSFVLFLFFILLFFLRVKAILICLWVGDGFIFCYSGYGLLFYFRGFIFWLFFCNICIFFTFVVVYVSTFVHLYLYYLYYEIYIVSLENVTSIENPINKLKVVYQPISCLLHYYTMQEMSQLFSCLRRLYEINLPFQNRFLRTLYKQRHTMGGHWVRPARLFQDCPLFRKVENKI